MQRGTRFNRLVRWFHLFGNHDVPCPHCLALIGGGENVCPRCRRILRFEGIAELRARGHRSHSP